jgi:hypothetical protein
MAFTSCGHIMDFVTPEAGFESRVEDEEKKVERSVVSFRILNNYSL